MLDQSLNVKNLARVRRTDDEYRFHIKSGTIDQRISDLAAAIDDGTFVFKPFKKIEKADFIAYTCDDFETALVVRKLNDSLRRLYKVRQSDRGEIVQQVKGLLSETTPKHVIKLDVASFYDTVNRQAILQKLVDDHLLSYRSKKLLALLFDTAFPELGSGVPRGLNIRATLAEIFMRDFDVEVKRVSGVYYYARYVDDIIVFTHAHPFPIKKSIGSLLPSGLKLNKKKSREIFTVDCRCHSVCSCLGDCKCRVRCACKVDEALFHKMDYLGYSFSFFDVNEARRDKANRVVLSIADKKIKKIKARLVRSVLDYARRPDFALLSDRLKFLTGNFVIKDVRRKIDIKTGIYYNYHLIENGKTDSALRDLNLFLRSGVFASSSRYGKIISKNLSIDQKRQLSKYSFISGFSTRRLSNFKPKRIRQITECWLYE